MENEEIILNQLKDLKSDNFNQHQEIINTFNRANDSQQKLLDNHCERLRACEKELVASREENKPFQKFVEDIQGKILTGFLALLVVLGTIIYAFIHYIEKKA